MSLAVAGLWLSADGSNVFAVGDAGTIVHYDGSVWSTINVGDAVLREVWGSSANNVFAVRVNRPAFWELSFEMLRLEGSSKLLQLVGPVVVAESFKNVISPERIEALGFVEVPWLAEEMGFIVDADPGLALAIYRRHLRIHHFPVVGG